MATNKALERQKQIQRNHEESVSVAISVLTKGSSKVEVEREVIDFRKSRRLSLKPKFINSIIGAAVAHLANEHSKDKDFVIPLHVERYNSDILSILEQKNPFEDEHDVDCDDKEDLYKVKQRLIASYYQALGTMQQKERLLGMHTKDFQIYIANTINIQIDQPEKRHYDLSKLSFEQKVDFLNLILKAKKNEFEVGNVILRNEIPGATETIDIPHEVIDESPNIEKIKHEIKTVDRKNQEPTGTFGVNMKLMETLKKKAAEEFKGAGSKNA